MTAMTFVTVLAKKYHLVHTSMLTKFKIAHATKKKYASFNRAITQ